MYGQLNLISSRPMQIYNANETGISIVHKQGKVVAELGHCNYMPERGKTHTVLSRVSVSGHITYYCPQ